MLKIHSKIAICLIALSMLASDADAQMFQGKPRFMELFQRQQPVPVKYEATPTLERLIADINAQSTRIRQLDNRVTIAVPGTPKINGTLQVEFPNRMRLKAGVMGMSEMGVDAGSNNELFWVWSKVNLPNQPPAMYFAKHAEFGQSQLRQQLPFEPKWLIDAFGILTLDPQGQHFGPYPDNAGRMRLYTSVTNSDGAQAIRVLLINANSGIVEQIAMYDTQSNLVAWSNASNFQYDQENDVSLPRRVALHMVQANQQTFQITVDLGGYSINSLHGDPELMWAYPNPSNVQTIDLGR
ncbi:MAG: hypothetical protein AAFN77_10205 [Planctomycetota bacterium]